VGDDGEARVAYATGDRLVYARVKGDELVRRTIASVDRTIAVAPVLVLGAGNAASLLWTQDREAGGGCAGPGPGPRDGTYFATNAGGNWATERISRSVGPTSMTLDPATGRVHVILSDDGLRYLTRKADGSWTDHRIRRTDGMWDAIIRLDPVRHRIVVVMSDYDHGLFIVTKG
jgi:hypothetical protein